MAGRGISVRRKGGKEKRKKPRVIAATRSRRNKGRRGWFAALGCRYYGRAIQVSNCQLFIIQNHARNQGDDERRVLVERKRTRSIAVSPRRKPVPSLRSASACETGLCYGRVEELREKTFFWREVAPSQKGKKNYSSFCIASRPAIFCLRCVAREMETYPA